MRITKFQIGKNGITEGTTSSLMTAFKNHKQIRISVLKSSGRDRNSIESMAELLKKNLESGSKSGFSYKIIGFTIILIKHSLKSKRNC